MHKHHVALLAALVSVGSACSPDYSGKIPCSDDAQCPTAYHCAQGKCESGASVPPTLTSFDPAGGTGVGMPVALHGTGLTGATAVSFNGTAQPIFTVASDTEITTTVPAGATTGPIQVTTSAGSASSASFTVLPTPALTSIEPPSGGVGANVTISGSFLSGATAVSFNGTAQPQFTLVSASSITTTVPSGATSGPVLVTTPGGTTAATISFTVIPAPAITSVSPASGAAVGHTVTIDGTNLDGASEVDFGSTAQSVFSVNASGTEIVTTVPVGATTGAIDVITPGGVAFSANDFVVFQVPTISGFLPVGGAGVGLPVTIDGENFDGATAVTFNNVPAVFTVLASGAEIQTTVPAGASSGPISVTTPGGSALSPDSFTVLPPPNLTGFTPARGGAGASVTISGSNLQGATAVQFNGVAANVQATTANSILTSVPNGASTGAISVSTPGGTATSTTSFTFIPAPVITGFTPASGAGIGMAVVIQGANLANGTVTVTFNGTLASNINSISQTSITAIVPPSATTGPITVSNDGGSASSTTFAVVPPPTLSSFSPAGGAGVGMPVTLSGTGLSNALSVSFNGTAATIQTNTDTTITTLVPANAQNGPITVTTNGGQASVPGFQVLPTPTITSVAPAVGAGIGTQITIEGTNLFGAAQVQFASSSGSGVSAAILSNTAAQIFVDVPNGAVTGPITVTTAGGSAQSASYTIYAAPTITSLSPAGGTGVGMPVTITGTNLSNATVTFSGTGVFATIQSNTATWIVALVPNSAFTGSITVTTPGGTATSSSYTIIPAPTIQTVSPASGAGVGVAVTINGQNLSNASAVSFNGTAATLTSNSATSINTTVPAGATSGQISVTTPGGTALSPVFTVIPAPSISSISPAGGAGIGQPITITGSNLSSATVTFSGASAPAAISTNSASAISVTVPSGAVSGSVTVTTPGGTTSQAFTVVPAPSVTGFSPSGGAGVGLKVTITGSNLSNATVLFNGSGAAATLLDNTATQIDVNVPATASTGPITISTPGGSTSTGTFTVVPTPAISGFSPASGAGVGMSVQISGSNFNNATVTFPGASSAASITSQSASQLVVTIPTNAFSGQVTVSTPGGSASAYYTIIPTPAITGFSPSNGTGVGMQLTIAGSNLGDATVQFTGASAVAAIISNNSTSVVVTVPAGATTGAITVSTPGGSASANYTILPAPTINGFSPSTGPIGSTVTLTGTNLSNATVTFPGASSVATLGSNTATAINATVPSGATTGPITVSTAGGSANTSASFTVIPPPVVGSIQPAAGAPVGYTVTITGTNLNGATSVTFNGVGASILSDTSSQLIATVPNAATSGVIEITTPGGVDDSRSFTVLPNLCASGEPAYVFDTQMQGCPGTQPYTGRAATCGSNAHVCNADEWMINQQGTAPQHIYWTDDQLRRGCENGCTSNACLATLGGGTRVGTYVGDCAGSEMHVCGSVDGGLFDPEGNHCTVIGCGYNTFETNAYFGGCQGDDQGGSLCCSNAKPRLYVDAVNGLDTNAGVASGVPFKTITKALSVAASGQVVLVNPGVYDGNSGYGNGETFPMKIPPGVVLRGDERYAGDGAVKTMITGGEIILQANATLAGFFVTGSAYIQLQAANAVLRNNTIAGSNGNSTTVAVSSATNALLSFNRIENNVFIGLDVEDDASTARVENNSVTGNGYGLSLQGTGADFGGGPSNSFGHNILSCNSDANLTYRIANEEIWAENNEWDNASPSFSDQFSQPLDIYDSSSNATDAVNSGGASASGLTCAPSACSSSATATQQYDSYMSGCEGAVAIANAASLCASTCHVCSSQEYSAHSSSTVPAGDYWTSDSLNISGASSCTVFPGSSGCATGSGALVCSGTATDSNGNKCNVANCSYEGGSANAHMGGCAATNANASLGITAGALCCCE